MSYPGSEAKTETRTASDIAYDLASARSGDANAFSRLAEPHRQELMTYCYRMLGSIEDAEDLVQETFLRAWRRLETYEERASYRAWLYKIATNACLDWLEHRPKRTLPLELDDPANPTAPLPAPSIEKIWIEPYPDEWLAPASSNPEARYDAYESISLAFLVALHTLTPRQRTVFILADVLDWPTSEISNTLGISISASTSLLHRARATMKRRNISEGSDRTGLSIPDKPTRQLLDRYASAWESADIDGIIALLTENAAFPMPPLPVWFQGRTAIRTFISGTILFGEASGRWKLLPIHANGQPGFAFYRIDEATRTYHPYALQILSIENEMISDATTFGFPTLFQYFGLPMVLTSQSQ